MSAALQDHADQDAKASQIQQEINQNGGVSVGDDVPPGESPEGTMEVEGSAVLDPEQNKAITGIRELQMRASADESLDAPRQTGGKRKRRKKSRKKRKRWPPKRKSRRKKRRKGGDPHGSAPKITREIRNRYHNVTEIAKPPVWKQPDNRGGKRKKRTRKKKRRKRKKTRRKRR